MRNKGQKRKTPSEVRAEFERRGESITSWAIANGVSPNVVFNVLSGGPHKCVRGQSHKVAVLLGIKEGEIAA